MFLNASIAALLSIALDVYLIYRHWQTLSAYTILFLIVPISLQLVGQWSRALGYYFRIQKCYSIRSDKSLETRDPPEHEEVSLALVVAVRGINDLLFWSYISNLVMLVYVGLLLMRLDGLR